MLKTEFTFKVESLRKLPDPANRERCERYFAFCDTQNLPIDFPMDTNPRQQNLKTKVAKKILGGYLGEETGPMFHLLNRGLLLSAETVHFNNQTNELTVTMSDHEKHGLVDGGHTYRIVTDPENLQMLAFPQFVTVEIITGVEEDFELIAGARNTSVQVKEKSLAELEGRLDIVKQIVVSQPFKGDVAYVEFEDKPIDVQNIIALLTIFHNELHKNAHPVYCYSSKGRSLEVFLQNETTYRKLIPIAPSIFRLHDHVKRSMGEMYSSEGGRLGALKEVGYKDGKLKWPLYFSPKKNGDFEKIEYDIPDGFVSPILNALRFLVIDDPKSGAYDWRTDPVSFYDRVAGRKLVSLTIDASKELGRNPMAVGKSSRHWEGLYNYVAATFLGQKKGS